MDIRSLLGKSWIKDDIEVEINRAYLTTERDSTNPENFDYVLTLEYTLLNHSKEYYNSGSEIKIKVDNSYATKTYLTNTKYELAMPKLKTTVISSFGINGDLKNIELELTAPANSNERILRLFHY